MSGPQITQAAQDAWSALVNCEEDKCFGSLSRIDKQLRVLARFEAEIRAQAEAVARAEIEELVAAVDALDLRQLVAGWNGENRPDGPYEPHPRKLGVTLRTNAGQVYDLDAATEAVRALLARQAGGAAR